MHACLRHMIVACSVAFFFSCKKDNNTPGTGQNNTGGTGTGGTQQGNYSLQKLTLSTGERVVSPWVELAPDSVYTSLNIGSSLFRPMPTGFEDRVVSFYLPQGYMVTFASNFDGTGETATFVAVTSAIKANLPSRLRNNISYVRYIRFNNPEKKGTCSVSDSAVLAFGAQWHYTWGINKQSFPNQQFVPMTWGKGTCTDTDARTLIERSDVDHLLSFNEPDHASQSNVPVDTAVQRFKIMQKTGLRYVSPVVTQDEAFGTGKWLTEFMTKAQAQKLRVNAIAVHWYDWGNQTNNAATDSLTAERVFSRFVTYIERVRAAYPGYPIWVTEYNANINRSSETIHRYFMKLSTDWMNTISYIERYSYFFPPTVPGVNSNNTLTNVGAYWKSLTSPKAFTSNIVLDATIVP